MRGDVTDQPPDLIKTGRLLWNAWLSDLSLVMDSYMRSPAFLQWMKYGLRAMNETRRYRASFTAYSASERDQDPLSAPSKPAS